MERVHYRANMNNEEAVEQSETILSSIEKGEQTLLTNVFFDGTWEEAFNPFEIVKISENNVRYLRKNNNSGKVEEIGITLQSGDRFYELEGEKTAWVSLKARLLLIYSKKEIEPYTIEPSGKTSEFYLEQLKAEKKYQLYAYVSQIPTEMLTTDFLREAIQLKESFLNSMNSDQLTREMIDIDQEFYGLRLQHCFWERLDLFTDEEIVQFSLWNEKIIRNVDRDRLEKGLLKKIVDAYANENYKLNLLEVLSVKEDLDFRKKYGSKNPNQGGLIIKEQYPELNDENLEKVIYMISIERTSDGEEEPLIKWLFEKMEWNSEERQIFGYEKKVDGNLVFEFKTGYSSSKNYCLKCHENNTTIKLLEQIKESFSHLSINLEVKYQNTMSIEKFTSLVDEFLEKNHDNLNEFNQLREYRYFLDSGKESQLRRAYEGFFKSYESKKVEMVLDVFEYTWMGTRQTTKTVQGTIKKVSGDYGYGLFQKGSRTRYIELTKDIHSIKIIKKFD